MKTIIRFFALTLAAVVALTSASQRLAVLSDIHVTPGNANDSALRVAVVEINASDVAAVIVSGDLTNEGSDVQLANVKQILDGLTKPCYVIPGNHENNWSQSACQTFSRLWGEDRFCFMVDSLLVVATNCGPCMKMGDGHCNPNDLTWIGRTLREKMKPGVRVLSVNHYPLKDDMDNYIDYLNVLRNYPVVAHMHGHYHKWMQYQADNGLECLGVRALDMRDGKHGYTLLEVSADSVKAWNKPIGLSPELVYAFAVSPTPLPKMSRLINKDAVDNPLFVVERLASEADAGDFGASIFTRVGCGSGRTVFYGTSKGEVVARNAERELWRRSFDCGMLFSRPAVSGKYLVVPTGDNRLLMLDWRDGDVLAPAIDMGGPVVADGVVSKGVLFQGGFKCFTAIDVKKQLVLWRYDNIGNYCQGAPVVDGNDVIFGAWDGYLRCLDRKSGRLKWQWDNGKPDQHLLSPGNVVPAVTRDRVIIVAPDRRTTCLDRKSGRELWRHYDKELKVRESLGLSEDKKTVYAKTMDGTVVAFDATANEYRQLWNTDVGFGYEHAPCVLLEHNGLVYTGSRRGVVAVLDARTGRLLFRRQLGHSEVNGFELDSRGDVVLSLIEGTVYRISTKR